MENKYNLVNGKTYKEISSEEEYNLNLIEYKNQLIKFSSPFKMIKDPIKFYDEFMALMDWCEGIGLFDKAFCDDKRKKIIDGYNNADLKERFKKKLRKMGVLKE